MRFTLRPFDRSKLSNEQTLLEQNEPTNCCSLSISDANEVNGGQV